MILSRRNFLKGLVPAAAGGLVLTEELLHPGRVFFLPPRPKHFTWDVYSDISHGGEGYYEVSWPIEHRVEPGGLIVNDTVAKLLRQIYARDVKKLVDDQFMRTMLHGRSFTRFEYTDERVKVTPIVNFRNLA